MASIPCCCIDPIHLGCFTCNELVTVPIQENIVGRIVIKSALGSVVMNETFEAKTLPSFDIEVVTLCRDMNYELYIIQEEITKCFTFKITL